MIDIELARHDWGSLRAAGPANDVPAALRALSSADSPAAADAAYWRIDNTVVVQGALFQSAEATAAAAVTALWGSTSSGRARLLELLGQLASGETAPSEIAAGNTDLAERCLREVARGFPMYAAILGETTDPEEVTSAVDLVGLSARADASLKDRARFYLEEARKKSIPEGVKKLITNWVGELDA
jgi:hypothetical protein